MKINLGGHSINIDTKKIKNQAKKAHKNIAEVVEKAPVKAKRAAIIATFLLPTIGIVNKCANTEKDPNDIEIVDKPITVDEREKFLEIKESTFDIVKPREGAYAVGKRHNVSDRRILHANNLSAKDIVHPGDTLFVPKSYVVKNIENLEDIGKLTGLSDEYLETLRDFEKVFYNIENDSQGNPTIGIGHWVQSHEKKNFKNGLNDKQIYNLLGQDLINIELDVKTKIPDEIFDKMPSHLREAVLDLAFNKGPGAVIDNKKLCDALNAEDYVTAIANLNQDYSIKKLNNGKTVKKYSSGLSKRRLYDISHASQIFKNGMPDKILASAKEVYEKGLTYMEEEAKNGEIKKEAYPNVLAEYKNLAYEWFDGKIGEKSDKKTNVKNDTKIETAANENNTVKQEVATKPAKTTNISGNKINSISTWSEYCTQMQNPLVTKDAKVKTPQNRTKSWTAEELRNSCIKGAKKEAKEKFQKYCKKNGIKYNEKDLDLSAFDRIPYPVIDKAGNIIVDHTKILKPQKPNGKTVIINPGHGGYNSRNGLFDVGAYYFSKRKNNKYGPVIEYEKMIEYGDQTAKKLQQAGYEVVLTTGGHLYTFNDNKSFTKIVDSLINGKFDGKKRNTQNVVFLSFHADETPDPKVKGAGVCYDYRHTKYDKKFAEIMNNNLNKGAWIISKTIERGKNKDGLQQLYQTEHIPSLLLEVDYLNGKHSSNLESSGYRTQFIDQVLAGLNDYYNIK